MDARTEGGSDAAPETAWKRFRRDTIASARVWAQQPALPVLTLLIWLLITPLRTSAYAGFLVPIYAFALGFFGMQREWYADAFAGTRPTAGRVWTGSWRYFVRLLPIALVVVVGLPLFVSFVVIRVIFRLSPAENFHEFVVRSEIAFVAMSFVIDLFLTFVMPALVFTTANSFKACRIGWRYLRRCWRTVKWHALVPPMTILAIGQVTSGRHAVIYGTVISLAGATLNLLFKGTQLRAYFDNAADLGVPINDPTHPERGQRANARPSRRERAEAARKYDERNRW